MAKANSASKAVTRADISDSIYREIGLPRCEAERLVAAVIDELTGSLLEGNNVKISSFGTFLVRHKKSRLGRNPRTGEAAEISDRRVLIFRPGSILKDKVRGEADAEG